MLLAFYIPFTWVRKLSNVIFSETQFCMLVNITTTKYSIAKNTPESFHVFRTRNWCEGTYYPYINSLLLHPQLGRKRLAHGRNTPPLAGIKGDFFFSYNDSPFRVVVVPKAMTATKLYQTTDTRRCLKTITVNLKLFTLLL